MGLSLDAVIATEDLKGRPWRKRTPEDLMFAYDSLAKELAGAPDRLLQSLVETAMELCGAQSAGISILEQENDTSVFRWRAVAGEYARFLGNSMPRENSPCGAVFDQRHALLMILPERHYTYLVDVSPQVVEVLLVPFFNEGQLKGTIWAVSHEVQRQFCADDLQTMIRLSSFAAAGYQARMSLLDLRKSNEELALAHTALKAAEHRKDEFLAILSHELRTPLMAILGWSQILKDKNAGEDDVEKAAETIQRNARMQAELIEDLLDMNRILTGKLRLSLEDVDLAELIDSSITSIEPQANEKRIALRRQLDPAARIVRGDKARLQQCIWNLLTNAIKFTPAGGSVDVGLRPVAGQAEICVQDSGIGIAPEFIGSVFDRFSQVDSTVTRKNGGLGLGLPIVKSLVELHHGTLSVASPGLNAGSTFHIVLPLSETDPSSFLEKTPVAPEPKVNISGLRILLVDDEKDSREVIAFILSNEGAIMQSASSAEDALRALQSESYDLLISDVAMPRIDGYEFLRRVRHREKASLNYIPAIALTAHVRSDERTMAMKAGYDTVLAKPIETDELVATIARVTHRRT